MERRKESEAQVTYLYPPPETGGWSNQANDFENLFPKTEMKIFLFWLHLLSFVCQISAGLKIFLKGNCAAQLFDEELIEGL